MRLRLLLLCGSSEAVQIARAISKDSNVLATASYGSARQNPTPLGVPTRIGGWGGADPFRDWLSRQNIGAVLDATHPFADKISHRTAEICAEMGVPYARFLRPSWVPGPGDSWTFLNTIEDASNNIPAGSTVYATTGRRELAALRALDDCIVHCRIRNTTDAEFPLAKGRFIRRLTALPVEVEAANFAEWGVDWVVARNTGSGASSTELEVARRLALPVAMIRRPKQPDALRIETISEALLWIRRRV